MDATVGGPNANSYVTLDQAVAYFADRLSTEEWDGADEVEQGAALVMATARLDTEEFVGFPATTTQRLQWPRYGVTDRRGLLYDSTAIPAPIQEATFELALAYLGDPDLLGGATGLAEFENLRLGSLDVTPRQAVTGALPPRVMQLVAPLRRGGFQARVVRA